MLALPIVLLLALPAPLSTAGSPSVNGGGAPPILPYGSASGSWTAAEFRADGTLEALLLDPSGYPTFAFDGRMDAAGSIVGELHALAFAFGAMPVLEPLKVVGKAQLPIVDGSRFSASIFSPLEGPIPVHPFGAIEGVLLLPSHRSLIDPLVSAAVQSAQAEIGVTLRSQAILCPAGRVAAHSGQGAGKPGQASGSAIRPIVVGPPQVPGHRRYGQAGIEPPRVLNLSDAPALPPSGEGSLRARWYLLP